MKRSIILSCTLCLLGIAIALATVPQKLYYQAILENSEGKPVTTSTQVIFTIWDADEMGSALWAESLMVSPSGIGAIALKLGEVHPLGEDVLTGEPRYLGIQVGGDAEMAQRAELVSGPYAMRVSTLDGSKAGEVFGQVTVSPGDEPPALLVTGSSGESVKLAPSEGDILRGTNAGGDDAVTIGYGVDGGGMVSIYEPGEVKEGSSISRLAFSLSTDDDGLLIYDANGNLVLEVGLGLDGGGAVSFFEPGGKSAAAVKKAELRQDGLVLFGATEADTNMSIRDSSVRFPDGTHQFTQAGASNGLPLAGGTMTGPILSVGAHRIHMGKGNFGSGNSNPGSSAFVAGINSVAGGEYAAVSGGFANRASDSGAAVGGGSGNTAEGLYSFVGGGVSNHALGAWSFVGGGQYDSAGGENGTIGGGYRNIASGMVATIGGGAFNIANKQYATIGGGYVDSALGDYSTVAGGRINTASGFHSAVGGGMHNTASGDRSTVGGGEYNLASNFQATVGGGNHDTASGVASTIGGGMHNTASGDQSTVGGGEFNLASNFHATVGGGLYGTASGDRSTVGGGYRNEAAAYATTVGGGYYNDADSAYATVGGGSWNKARGFCSVVAGGGGTNEADSNSASGDYSAIGGGRRNIASDTNATICGGTFNSATGRNASIGGGRQNTASSIYVTIGGGVTNKATNWYATVGGGLLNIASGLQATVAGGSVDSAIATGATVSGGSHNTARYGYSTVAGGQNNSAGAAYSVVGGGQNDTASGHSATIAGGLENRASGDQSTVGGGRANLAFGEGSVVGGGYYDTATGAYSTVSGGVNNIATAYAATVPGGYTCAARANYSFAAGRQAKVGAGHSGTFLWADARDCDFNSVAAYEFAARATGGVRFVTGVTQCSTITAGVQVAAGGGSWSSMSDKNLKEHFKPVDSEEILNRVASLPISTWNYMAQDESIRHIGPMAQDFHAAFGVGEDERHITAIDADGIALAAIQSLYKKTKLQSAEIDDLRSELKETKSQVNRLITTVETLLSERNSAKAGGDKLANLK